MFSVFPIFKIVKKKLKPGQGLKRKPKDATRLLWN